MTIKIIDDNNKINIKKPEKPINLEIRYLKRFNITNTDLEIEADEIYFNEYEEFKQQKEYIYKVKYDVSYIKRALIKFYSLTKYYTNHIQKNFLKRLVFISYDYNDIDFTHGLLNFVNKLIKMGYLKKYYYYDDMGIINIMIGINFKIFGFKEDELNEMYEFNNNLISEQENIKKELDFNNLKCFCGNHLKLINKYSNPKLIRNNKLIKLNGVDLYVFKCNFCNDFTFKYIKHSFI